MRTSEPVGAGGAGWLGSKVKTLRGGPAEVYTHAGMVFGTEGGLDILESSYKACGKSNKQTDMRNGLLKGSEREE